MVEIAISTLYIKGFVHRFLYLSLRMKTFKDSWQNFYILLFINIEEKLSIKYQLFNCMIMTININKHGHISNDFKKFITEVESTSYISLALVQVLTVGSAYNDWCISASWQNLHRWQGPQVKHTKIAVKRNQHFICHAHKVKHMIIFPKKILIW